MNNKYKRVLIILLIVMSPLVVGLIAPSYKPPDSVVGIEATIAILVGIPITFVIGFITSYIAGKRGATGFESLLGYVIPAAFFCLRILLSP